MEFNIIIGTPHIETHPNGIDTRTVMNYTDGSVEYSEWRDLHVCISYDDGICVRCGKINNDT